MSSSHKAVLHTRQYQRKSQNLRSNKSLHSKFHLHCRASSLSKMKMPLSYISQSISSSSIDKSYSTALAMKLTHRSEISRNPKPKKTYTHAGISSLESSTTPSWNRSLFESTSISPLSKMHKRILYQPPVESCGILMKMMILPKRNCMRWP
jgi:hypothetical protein